MLEIPAVSVENWDDRKKRFSMNNEFGNFLLNKCMIKFYFKANLTKIWNRRSPILFVEGVMNNYTLFFFQLFFQLK
jgi:hypothetical protein